MERTKLRALSPADGRYADKVGDLRDILSEYGLIRYRVLVEVRWLQWMADDPAIAELPPSRPRSPAATIGDTNLNSAFIFLPIR